MLPPDAQNVLEAERDAAIRSLKREQDASELRISGLESELRAAQQAEVEREDRAGRDAEFHAALARFQSQPMQRSDYTVAQNKALLTQWLCQRGFTTPKAQCRAIEAVLRARGHAR